MILHCLSSGSSGNCYLLETENETLILDCGIDIQKIKKGLNWDISRIAGVCVTHSHNDHSKSVKNFEDMGIDVWKPYCERNLTDHMKFGGFSVRCFPLPHNGTPNYGYYIKCAGQKILYLTDFEYCPYVFKKQEVNHILVEANHSKELLDREKANYEHSIRGHADIDTTCKFLDINKTKHLRNVILVHLSSECGDEILFKEQVEKVVDCPVYIAKAGLEIELKESNCPF